MKYLIFLFSLLSIKLNSQVTTTVLLQIDNPLQCLYTLNFETQTSDYSQDTTISNVVTDTQTYEFSIIGDQITQIYLIFQILSPCGNILLTTQDSTGETLYFNMSITGFDLDGDSYYRFEDCDDSDPYINVNSQEIVDNIDNDCDGLVDFVDTVFGLIVNYEYNNFDYCQYTTQLNWTILDTNYNPVTSTNESLSILSDSNTLSYYIPPYQQNYYLLQFCLQSENNECVTLYQIDTIWGYEDIINFSINNTLDTCQIFEQVTILDTIVVQNIIYLYDTTSVEEIVYDTLEVENVVNIYDTLEVENVVNIYDTLQNVIYDTLTVSIYDTLTIIDTVIIENLITVYDTTNITVTDTLLIILTGTDENSINTLLIYPNPASSQIIVNWGLWQSEFTSDIINQSGQIVYSTPNYSGISEIDISTWSSGIYFVRIFKNNLLFDTRKIMIQ